MRKSWGLLPKILDGSKTVESRWYKQRRSPWNKIKAGDTIFFKDSGGLVTAKAKVTKVSQYIVDSNRRAVSIMHLHAKEDLGSSTISKEVLHYISNKKYAIFVWFGSVREIEPFKVDKTGYGMQSAWITVKDIDVLKEK